MPNLLANAFSYGDFLKRKVGGLLSDPMATLEQMAGQLSDDQRTNGENMANAYPMAGDKSVLVTPAGKARAQGLLADYGAQSGMAGMIAGQKFVYPQGKALATAQRNAALPVEQGGLGLHPQNTPMERAQAMGMDTDLLHGTTNDFPAFSESTRHSTYATQDPVISDIYANATNRHKAFREINAGPNVIPLTARGKLLETSDYRNGSGGWLQNNMADALGVEPRRGLTKELQSFGYDGAKVSMDDLGGSQVQFMYPDPKVLRSRFAAFDPARINENDLLAGALPLGVMADEDSRNKLRGLLGK